MDTSKVNHKIYISKRIFNTLSPVMLTSRVFGLTPFVYSEYNSNTYQISLSAKYIVYSYILVVGLGKI